MIALTVASGKVSRWRESTTARSDEADLRSSTVTVRCPASGSSYTR